MDWHSATHRDVGLHAFTLLRGRDRPQILQRAGRLNGIHGEYVQTPTGAGAELISLVLELAE